MLVCCCRSSLLGHILWEYLTDMCLLSLSFSFCSTISVLLLIITMEKEPKGPSACDPCRKRKVRVSKSYLQTHLLEFALHTIFYLSVCLHWAKLDTCPRVEAGRVGLGRPELAWKRTSRRPNTSILTHVTFFPLSI